MIDFSTLKGVTIPEGNVKEIAIGGVTVWKKVQGVPIGTLEVGDSVFLNVNGVSTEFLVVHQGLPDTTKYDASCNGTWLLMKDVYTTMKWDAGSNCNYHTSDIHSYVNETFLGLMDSSVANAIKQVKIPYLTATINNNHPSDKMREEYHSGSDGLSTKIFLLSSNEVGWTYSQNSNMPLNEGVRLDFFKNAVQTDVKRVGFYNGSATIWWLRSPDIIYSNYIWRVGIGGEADRDYSQAEYTTGKAAGVRPAFILPSSFCVVESDTARNTCTTCGTILMSDGRCPRCFGYCQTCGAILKSAECDNCGEMWYGEVCEECGRPLNVDGKCVIHDYCQTCGMELDSDGYCPICDYCNSCGSLTYGATTCPDCGEYQ